MIPIGLWFVMCVCALAIIFVVDYNIEEKVKKKSLATIIGAAYWIFALVIFFSPFYLEFPGESDGYPAVVNGDEITYHPYGIFEPTAEGKIIRLPDVGDKTRFVIVSERINAFPKVILGNIEVFYRIFDLENLGKCQQLRKGLLKSKLNSSLTEIALEIMTEEIEKIVISKGFSMEKPSKESVEKYFESISNKLQKRLDSIESGITIVQVGW